MDEDYKSDKYSDMWYKAGHNIGIRRKFGACNQCFSIGGKRCGLSEESIRQFGKMVLKKLDAGMSEEEVKAWADEAMQRDG